MGRYTAIPENAFDGLQLDAGMLLKNFDLEEASNGNLGFSDSDIICATTGGINPTCVPTYSDFAEDVDNAPTNLKEFKHLDGWECKIATTSLGNSPELIKISLGAADIDVTNTGKIIPRRNLKQTDFSDIWWVGDRADGGFVAIKLMNALSSGGFSLQTTKNGKGQVSLEITGHVSITSQDTVPMEFYSIDPATYTVTFDSDGGSEVATQTVDKGETATEPEDPTKAGYVFEGWYTEAEHINAYDFSTAVNENITLYANWTAVHTVTFNSNGGSEVSSATVENGETVTQPADPTKASYTFAGWYSDEELTTAYVFSTPVTADITLYAKWTEA